MRKSQFFLRLSFCGQEQKKPAGIKPFISAKLELTTVYVAKAAFKHKEGNGDMRRNRKNNIRRERIVMLASSAFVLAALTMTGIYMKERNTDSKNDGYTIDFTTLDENVDNKYQEIARNFETNNGDSAQIALNGQDKPLEEQINLEDDLDYMPMEAGSHLVEIPGLTDGSTALMEEPDSEAVDVPDAEDAEEEDDDSEEDEETGSNSVVLRELHFSDTDGLTRPVQGDILMHYSMDSSVYFATLDQYKYNPAVMFQAEEGNVVSACAAGQVVNIFEDSRLGHAVTIYLGDGYEATYGQLKDIEVTKNSYVNAGDTIGSVAAPTKYFSVEGSNLYFELTKDGEPVNPENLF